MYILSPKGKTVGFRFQVAFLTAKKMGCRRQPVIALVDVPGVVAVFTLTYYICCAILTSSGRISVDHITETVGSLPKYTRPKIKQTLIPSLLSNTTAFSSRCAGSLSLAGRIVAHLAVFVTSPFLIVLCYRSRQ